MIPKSKDKELNKHSTGGRLLTMHGNQPQQTLEVAKNHENANQWHKPSARSQKENFSAKNSS